jgi:hypothetical protein
MNRQHDSRYLITRSAFTAVVAAVFTFVPIAVIAWYGGRGIVNTA